MKTTDFDYNLPQELIAQTPIEPRDQSRLMVINRKSGAIEHRQFFNIVDYLQPGDVMVFNESRVIPARLIARRANGGKAEVLLLRRLNGNLWEALVKPGKRLHTGATIEVVRRSDDKAAVKAEITGEGQDGIREIRFSDDSLLPDLGEVPLPPYIHLPLSDPERYQTVYSRSSGSAAAPTAGLHFTPSLIADIESKGITCLFVTLHVGLDTFRPIMEDDPREHVIYKEYGIISEDVASQLNRAKKEGRRIICVGTTSVRCVEQAAQSGQGEVTPLNDMVSLYILPGYQFRMVDALLTNFHLPKSSLLMLVSAFAGKDLIDRAYQTAIQEKYRFYSFGDAMLVL
jgi:S-adenosylmethionine:tRNA ribosyltransferase-isomerase